MERAKGLDVDPAEAVAAGASVGAAATTTYQVLVSTMQRKWPIVGALLGSTKVPTYRNNTAQSVHAGQDLSNL